MMEEKGTNLLLQALIKYFSGLVVVGSLLFLPAGTFDYWNAWLLIGLLFFPMLLLGLLLWFKDKTLLRKRLNSRENENEQRYNILLSLILFVTGFVIAGLDFRFNWTNLPLWAIVLASILFFLAYTLYAEVMRENTYLSRTVEIQENQKVIDSGLYGMVRHPMYFATSMLFLSIPIILNSWVSFIIFLIFPFILSRRIKNEETILENNLSGYKEYMEKVKYKMIPFIW